MQVRRFFLDKTIYNFLICWNLFISIYWYILGNKHDNFLMALDNDIFSSPFLKLLCPTVYLGYIFYLLIYVFEVFFHQNGQAFAHLKFHPRISWVLFILRNYHFDYLKFPCWNKRKRFQQILRCRILSSFSYYFHDHHVCSNCI